MSGELIYHIPRIVSGIGRTGAGAEIIKYVQSQKTVVCQNLADLIGKVILIIGTVSKPFQNVDAVVAAASMLQQLGVVGGKFVVEKVAVVAAANGQIGIDPGFIQTVNQNLHIEVSPFLLFPFFIPGTAVVGAVVGRQDVFCVETLVVMNEVNMTNENIHIMGPELHPLQQIANALVGQIFVETDQGNPNADLTLVKVGIAMILRHKKPSFIMILSL